MFFFVCLFFFKKNERKKGVMYEYTILLDNVKSKGPNEPIVEETPNTYMAEIVKVYATMLF